MNATTKTAQLRISRSSPAYWRVTFDNPPLNVMGPQFVQEFREIEQAGGRRTWYQRDHGQGAPRSGDAEDEGRLSSRVGYHGRETRPAACAKGLMSSLGFVLLGALAVIIGAHGPH